MLVSGETHLEAAAVDELGLGKPVDPTDIDEPFDRSFHVLGSHVDLEGDPTRVIGDPPGVTAGERLEDEREVADELGLGEEFLVGEEVVAVGAEPLEGLAGVGAGLLMDEAVLSVFRDEQVVGQRDRRSSACRGLRGRPPAAARRVPPAGSDRV